MEGGSRHGLGPLDGRGPPAPVGAANLWPTRYGGGPHRYSPPSDGHAASIRLALSRDAWHFSRAKPGRPTSREATGLCRGLSKSGGGISARAEPRDARSRCHNAAQPWHGTPSAGRSAGGPYTFSRFRSPKRRSDRFLSGQESQPGRPLSLAGVSRVDVPMARRGRYPSVVLSRDQNEARNRALPALGSPYKRSMGNRPSRSDGLLSLGEQRVGCVAKRPLPKAEVAGWDIDVSSEVMVPELQWLPPGQTRVYSAERIARYMTGVGPESRFSKG
jgi:hypothetical protein